MRIIGLFLIGLMFRIVHQPGLSFQGHAGRRNGLL